MGRPDDLEHLSLAEFVRDYKIVYQPKAEKHASKHINTDQNDDFVENDEAPGQIRWLKNRKGRFRKNKDTMVRYHLSKHNDTEIKRSLLVLFCPFRDEMAEIHEVKDRSVDYVYALHKDAIEVLCLQFEPNRQLLLSMEKAMNDYEKEDEYDVDDDMLYDDDENADEQYDENRETTSELDLKHFMRLASGPKANAEIDITKQRTVCEMIRKLNADQRQIFDDIMERLTTENETSGTDSAVPFHLYIAGRAGTGKTFLMKTVIEASKLVLMKSGDDFNKPTVLVLAPTASAARLIGGQTVESAMTISRSSECESYQVFSNNATSAYEYQQIRAIFIDEISMVGSNKLHLIHTRCEELLGRDNLKGKPFAGLPVICTGDLLQLPPVKDRWIFANNERHQQHDNTAPNKWKINFKMYEMTEKMRSLEDPEFSALCDRIGTNTLNSEDHVTLRSRIVDCANEHSNESYEEGKLAIIVTDNMKRSQINHTKLDSLEETSTVFPATDVCTNVGQYNELTVLHLPYTQTGSLPTSLEIKLDAPVMLTINIDKSDGLTNGARGFVADIDQKHQIVWVKFHGNVGSKATRIGRRKYKYSHTWNCIHWEKKSFVQSFEYLGRYPTHTVPSGVVIRYHGTQISGTDP